MVTRHDSSQEWLDLSFSHFYKNSEPQIDKPSSFVHKELNIFRFSDDKHWRKFSVLAVQPCYHAIKTCYTITVPVRCGLVQQWIGSINKVMNVKSSMDGEKKEPLLLNKWIIQSLMWQNLSLLFDAIGSEKYVGYAICQASKKAKVAQSNAFIYSG